LGCAVGWLLGHRVASSGAKHQWHSGSNRRLGATQTWRPAPRAVRGARHLSARDGVESSEEGGEEFETDR
jgi:hypothetical protein